MNVGYINLDSNAMMFQSGEDWLSGVEDEYSTHSHPSALEKRKDMHSYGLLCFCCK